MSVEPAHEPEPRQRLLQPVPAGSLVVGASRTRFPGRPRSFAPPSVR